MAVRAGWRGFLGTPVAHYFITAAHIDPAASIGNVFFHNDLLYTNIAFSDGSHAKNFGDLRLYRTDETFYSFAPLYNATSDGSELTQGAAVIIGRGTQRGSAINVTSTLGTEQKGQLGPLADSATRWGQNKVSGIANNLLQFTFDRTGMGDSVSNEVHLSSGDSGGGVFLNVNGQWKVAGVNFSVDSYRLTNGGPLVNAAFYDTGGIRQASNSEIPDKATDIPSGFYASRVSSGMATILPWLDLNPTWNINASSTWPTKSQLDQQLGAQWHRRTGGLPHRNHRRADGHALLRPYRRNGQLRQPQPLHADGLAAHPRRRQREHRN